MTPARSGREREYRVRDHLHAAGWTLVMRAAGSKGPADLLVAHPQHGPALVQVGGPGKHLGPADRARLLDAAAMCRALPVLARVVPRVGIELLVVRGQLSEWETWTP